jgi:CHAT domain-containing protein
VPRGAGGPAVIVADPLFGENTSASRRPAPYFAPLAATAEEGRAITALFPGAAMLTGRFASKSALLKVRSPRLLHIASHGFFQPDAPGDAAGNPLLRSGVALAGANLSAGESTAGVLTALEASGLNLWGTKLVTLSACDTGLGELRNGEGVYGLRRAFVVAGSETQVMSLWPVSDAVSRETMVAYYTALRAGLGRGDALRQAKLALLKRPSRQHPYYWASFTQSGEWASLDGRR